MPRDGQLIIFKTQNMSKTEQVKLSKKLYGYRDRSQYSRYLYDRPGALNQIPHVIPLGRKAILVTRPKDAQPIIQLLQQYNVQIYVRRIQLEEEDLQILAEKIEKAQNEDDQ